jgi:hypothetical protein
MLPEIGEDYRFPMALARDVMLLNMQRRSDAPQ